MIGVANNLALLISASALLLAGCAETAGRMPTARFMVAGGQSSAVNPQRGLTLVWKPDDYTNFIVFSSFDLKKPMNFWIQHFTDQTNFPIQPNSPQCFYQVRGVNLVTGESAWCRP